MYKNSDKVSEDSVKAPVKVAVAVREVVKPDEAEKLWPPATSSNEEFNRKVSRILNNLNPQNIDTSLQQLKKLEIHTFTKLQGVVDKVLEKVVDEPHLSLACACLCGRLALIQVPTSSNIEKQSDYVNFRKLLITRCQVEFEKQFVNESFTNQKLKEIEESNDLDERKGLLEEDLGMVRMKSLGNIRFIGELFKQHMLTNNIMMRCINILLENKDEQSLECLCTLLTTIGKELESNQVSLHQVFKQMKQLVDKEGENQISSQIRLMLQDVINLRNSRWPKRQDAIPSL